ncbi:MAG TPA: ABC transporter permease/substrate-binding protein [Vicinamibacteria bacterium]|nr:ABC transporter permease/substrate-binding protein [Vicinamibacteria bacterium]
MTEQLALLPEYLSAHVRLTLAALAAGILLAVPAGVVVARVRALEAPVLALAGVIQTVPALALLAMMVPLLSGLGLPGIGTLPAFLALVLYSLLPILRNAVTGLHGVDAAVLEAARGLGMTRNERLLHVELPLALPVIVAGVRTATVWTVGMATLSTPIGAPSLGNYIFGGLQTRNTAAILTGCVAAAVLALGLDAIVRGVAVGLSARRRRPLAVAALLLLALASWAWTPPARTGSASASRPIVVGAKTFTEQYVLAEILAGTVHARTGRATRTLPSLGSAVAFDALCRDEIDLYVDYTGTLWATVMGRKGAGGSRREMEAEVRRWLLERNGVTLAASLGFENAYCFAVRRDTAERLGLVTLSDLARHARDLSLASDYEFFAREEWRAVESAYGLAFRARRTMDPSLLYRAIEAAQVDAITAYSSDGRIEALGLVVLEDERRAIPPYDAVVLAGRRLAREAPDALAALRELDGAIDVARMRSLNRLVDEQGRSPAAAASSFLRDRRLHVPERTPLAR